VPFHQLHVLVYLVSPAHALHPRVHIGTTVPPTLPKLQACSLCRWHNSDRQETRNDDTKLNTRNHNQQTPKGPYRVTVRNTGLAGVAPPVGELRDKGPGCFRADLRTVGFRS
jgi:hypothetical protein